MTTIDRREFLQHGGAGIGVGLFGATSAAQSVGLDKSPTAPSDTVVRMTGDGLGLAPAETSALWARLAGDGEIHRDAYSNGGSVESLERDVASVLGKERAVFLPTGTLANHLAVRILAAPAGGRTRAIVQAESHLYNDSGDCVQTLSGITLLPLAPGRATFTLEDVQAAIARTGSGRVETPVAVMVVETPVRRRYGETFEPTELDRVVSFAQREGIRLHLDGARLFLQSAYNARSVAEMAAPFDTVYVSLYKYFNAPSGAILAGPRALLDGLFHERRMFGAGLPGAWPFAAIARHYLPGFEERFAHAVRASESWIERVTRHDAFAVERVPAGTNLFRLRVSGSDSAAMRERLRVRGVEVGMPGTDGATFLLAVNETWNRRPPDELAAIFAEALDA